MGRLSRVEAKPILTGLLEANQKIYELLPKPSSKFEEGDFKNVLRAEGLAEGYRKVLDLISARREPNRTLAKELARFRNDQEEQFHTSMDYALRDTTFHAAAIEAVDLGVKMLGLGRFMGDDFDATHFPVDYVKPRRLAVASA